MGQTYDAGDLFRSAVEVEAAGFQALAIEERGNLMAHALDELRRRNALTGAEAVALRDRLAALAVEADRIAREVIPLASKAAEAAGGVFWAEPAFPAGLEPATV